MGRLAQTLGPTNTPLDMPGFLDPLAPSFEAEYARYIDGDLLGKIITRNLLVNSLSYENKSIFTPLGRYGDAKVKYGEANEIHHDPGDGHIDIGERRITFEIKLARINIANRSLGHKTENWAFVNLLHSPAKAYKKYDVLIAIGVNALGLEDENYWVHQTSSHKKLTAAGYASNINALPHQIEFLSVCSFFIMRREEIENNYFRISVDAVEKSKHAKFRAWGYDKVACKGIWSMAISKA